MERRFYRIGSARYYSMIFVSSIFSSYNFLIRSTETSIPIEFVRVKLQKPCHNCSQNSDVDCISTRTITNNPRLPTNYLKLYQLKLISLIHCWDKTLARKTREIANMVSIKQVCISLVIFACHLGGSQNLTPAQDAKITTESSLSVANFDFWRNYIKASDTELEWQKLPWKMSFHEGLKEGAKLNKPILLWAMNGHPFGCT